MKTRTLKPVLSLRKPIIAHSKSALLLSTTALLVSASINAQQNDEPIVLDTMHIEERTSDTNPYAEAGAPYKAKISGDSRHVKPLADTPQTISVLTQTAIQESGKTDLKDILAAQPGITLGTGENGNAFGDRYIIRGYEARSDVFVDGLRDPGMTTRESFAVEQIEITKGPSSTFAGRGSTGGAINSVTKQASTEYNFNKVQAGLGTDNYRRIALDSNIKINDDAAIRANLLYSAKDIPDRAPADKERKGIALSSSLKATEKLNVIADIYYLDAKDKPDMGSFTTNGFSGGSIYKDIPVYIQDSDFLESETRTFTLRADYEINSNLTLENSWRYGTTENGYLTTSAHAGTRDASDPLAPNAETITFETHQGWQDVEYFVNMFNAFYDVDISDTKHQFVFGIEYSEMDVKNGNYVVSNNGSTNCIVGGRRGANPTQCMLDENGDYVANIGGLLDRTVTKGTFDSDVSIETVSLSIMDTITFNDDWSVFFGVRIDDFDYKNNIIGRGETAPTKYSYSDKLYNGHIGAIYTINEDANVYLTYSTSSNINGGESDTAGCGYGGVCSSATSIQNSKPEDTENVELGTKWNILDDKLLLTAAIFQITKSNVMESARGHDYDSTGDLLNNGKNRVKGIEVSAVGNLTEKLSTQFGASFMDAEVLESDITDNSPVGETLSNFAENSLFLQLRYQITPDIAFGGVARYSSEMYTGQPDTAPDGAIKVPSYTVFDAFVNYTVNEQLNVRLNIGNITDKDYYNAGYRNGGMMYIGNARNTQLTVSYDF